MYWGRRLKISRAGGTCANYPDFFENHKFHVIYCVTLAYVLFSKNFWFTIHVVDSWFWKIIDRICWAYAIFRWTPNLQACTDRRTDRRTIKSGLSWVTYLVPPGKIRLYNVCHRWIFCSQDSVHDPPTLIPFDWDSQLSACVITFWCHTGELVN